MIEDIQSNFEEYRSIGIASLVINKLKTLRCEVGNTTSEYLSTLLQDVLINEHGSTNVIHGDEYTTRINSWLHDENLEKGPINIHSVGKDGIVQFYFGFKDQEFNLWRESSGILTPSADGLCSSFSKTVHKEIKMLDDFLNNSSQFGFIHPLDQEGKVMHKGKEYMKNTPEDSERRTKETDIINNVLMSVHDNTDQLTNNNPFINGSIISSEEQFLDLLESMQLPNFITLGHNSTIEKLYTLKKGLS